MPKKKKTESEESSLKKTSEKESEEAVEQAAEKIEELKGSVPEEKKVEVKEAEEFPDIELGIDVFSAPNTEEASEKKLSEKELEEKKEKIEEIKETSKLQESKILDSSQNQENSKRIFKDSKRILKSLDFDSAQKLEKLKLISDKAKKLAEKIEAKENIIEEMKEELKEKEAEKQEKRRKRAEKTLFPLDDYVSYSTHLGTKAITPKMREFVYKRRADGLAVLNTNDIDKKLKEACEFIAKFSPEDIFLACKREVGWEAAKKFSGVTGIKVFTKKYPAGIITNSQLADFFEVELVIVCDPWLDKNALNDAVKIKKPVVALCDTNNLTTGATKVIPCNNKAGKSLGLILYLIAREYLKARGQEKEAKALQIEDFAEKVEGKEESVKEIKEDKEGRIIEEKTEDAAKSEKTIEKGAKEGV